MVILESSQFGSKSGKIRWKIHTAWTVNVVQGERPRGRSSSNGERPRGPWTILCTIMGEWPRGRSPYNGERPRGRSPSTIMYTIKKIQLIREN